MKVRGLWRRLWAALGPQPEAPPEGDPERIAAVQHVLDNLRPAFRADAGDMQLVRVQEDGLVILRPVGNCRGCGAKVLTLQGALDPKLREHCGPWFTGVRADDD